MRAVPVGVETGPWRRSARTACEHRPTALRPRQARRPGTAGAAGGPGCRRRRGGHGRGRRGQWLGRVEVGRHRVVEALPLGRQVPLARVHRVDLERFRQLREVEPHAQLGMVGFAAPHVAALEHTPATHLLDGLQRAHEAVERQLQPARGDAVLTRQRLIRQAHAAAGVDRFLVEPVPARARQLELDHEIERDALVQRVFQRRGQVEIERGGQLEAAILVFDLRFGILDQLRGRPGAMSEPEGQKQAGRDGPGAQDCGQRERRRLARCAARDSVDEQAQRARHRWDQARF